LVKVIGIREAPLGLHFVGRSSSARSLEFVDWLLRDYLPVDGSLSRAVIKLASRNAIGVFDDGELDSKARSSVWTTESPLRPDSGAARSHLPMLWSWCSSVSLTSDGHEFHCGGPSVILDEAQPRLPTMLTMELNPQAFSIDRSTFFHTAGRLRLLAAAMPGVRLELWSDFGLSRRIYQYPGGMADLLIEVDAGLPPSSNQIGARIVTETGTIELAMNLRKRGDSQMLAILDGAQIVDSQRLEESLRRGLGSHSLGATALSACISVVQHQLLGGWVHHPTLDDREHLFNAAEAVARKAAAKVFSPPDE